MELRALYREDDAVSSVLGVVLMVAVTIILAAVIGTFVLGIGSDLTDSSPSVSWETADNLNGSEQSVVLIHGGGDDVDRSNLEVTVGGETAYRNGDATNGYDDTSNWDDPVQTGSRLRVVNGTNTMNQGEMVRIIWHSEDKTTILKEHRLG